MVPAGRFVLLLAGVAATALGLALGATFQHERYLGPLGGGDTINLGEPIVLTGLIVAPGILAMVLALAPPLRQPVAGYDASRWTVRPAVASRLGASFVLLMAAYLAVFLVQTAWPTVVAARLSDASGPGARLPYFMDIGLLAANSRDMLPAAIMPVMALVCAALLAAAWACSLILAPAALRATPTARTVLARQIGALGLAAPFLALTGWGLMRLLVILPASAASGPYQLALPLSALAAWGLLVTSTIKTWHLARALRERVRAPLALDAWQGLERVEFGLAGGLAAIAAFAIVLPRAAADGLQASGAPFGMATLNILLHFLLMLAVPLAPLYAVHRQAVRLLQAISHGEVAPPNPAQVGRPALLWAIPAAAALSFLLAGYSTWEIPRALWGWVFAAVPFAVLGMMATPAVAAAPALLLCGGALWGVGNTVYATYQPGLVGLPEFDTSPGILGLWRLCAAALVALAFARIARGAAHRLRASAAVPLAIGFGIAVAVVGFVELPLSAGPDNSIDGNSIVVGSALAASDSAVQALYHGLAVTALLSGALMLARLLRPEWFGRDGGRPTPATDPALA